MSEPGPGDGADLEGPFIDMALRRIVLRDQHDSQMIYLAEPQGERTFAISIGRNEAEEMRRVVASVRTERPLTHQLLLESLRALGGDLLRVEISDLKRNTFHARLVLTGADGAERQVDARSSDAIALALRAGCPIRVAESVLQQVRIDLAPDTLPPSPSTAPDAGADPSDGEGDEDEDEEQQSGSEGPEDQP